MEPAQPPTNVQDTVPASEEQDPKTIKLTVRYNKLLNQTVLLNPKQTLSQLKQYLSETTVFYLFDNFHFTHNNSTLPQYAELDTIFTTEVTLDIIIDPYDERTSKYHVKKVQEISKNPLLWAVLNNPTPKTPSPEPNILTGLSIESSLEPALDNPLFTQSEYPIAPSKQTINFLNFSGYNPPPSYRKLNGDYFYLHLKTLQGVDFHITANARGFYINNSNINYFDPELHPQYNKVYTSLLDLLNNISPKFRQNFDQIINSVALTEIDRMALTSTYRNKNIWLKERKQLNHKWNAGARNENVEFEFDTSGVKDWNEMFQTQSQVPADNLIEKLNKSKMFFKIYSEFVTAATAGAKALVEGKMTPLNPLDDKLQHIYIHNSIFYSIAQETPYNYSQEKGLDATPTVSAVNADLRNTARILELGIPDLHVLHMALIEYRGFRVIAQCIIPGILTAEQLQCSQYGSIDDGKTIVDNKQFEFLMSKVCDKLDIDDNVEFVDGQGVTKKIAGSIQIKGILGSDKRKYILDLMRLSPRDYNYLGSDYHTCLLRPELITLYKESLVQGKKDESGVVGLPKLQPKLNVNLQIGVNFTRTEETEKQEELLKKMAAFLKQTCIPKLITSLATVDKRLLSDSAGIVQVFHKHGVSIRYLGEVFKHKLTSEYPQIKIALERVIIVKSLKHLIRMAMRDACPMHLSTVITRLLNCIFGLKTHRDSLQEGKALEEQSQPKKADEKQSKKKNKNKKKENTAAVQEESTEGGIVLPVSQYVNIKPSEAWALVRKLSEARYGHVLPESIDDFKGFVLPFNKLATLRDLCMNVGLKIEKKNYQILSNQKDLTADLPFHTSNIIELQPKPKHIPLVNREVSRLVQTADALLLTYKVEEAIEIYNNAVQYMIGLYGGLHKEIALVHHKIATIYYRLTDYDSAIACEKNSLEILNVLYGEDNVYTIESLSNIGLFYFTKGDKDKALFYLYKSLYLSNLAFGENYPEAIVNYMNISAIYQQNKQHKEAILSMLEALERVIKIYGRENINTAACYTGLANLHYETGDIKQSIDFQEKSLNALKHTLQENDPRLQDAVNLLTHYKNAFEHRKHQEEIKKSTQNAYSVAANTQQTPAPKRQEVRQQMEEPNSERAALLRKLQQAKWNSRMGHK